jgi:hypothetical protein
MAQITGTFCFKIRSSILAELSETSIAKYRVSETSSLVHAIPLSVAMSKYNALSAFVLLLLLLLLRCLVFKCGTSGLVGTPKAAKLLWLET